MWILNFTPKFKKLNIPFAIGKMSHFSTSSVVHLEAFLTLHFFSRTLGAIISGQLVLCDHRCSDSAGGVTMVTAFVEGWDFVQTLGEGAYGE